MVYQIYYGDNHHRQTLFDIEYYIKENEYAKDPEKKWVVELHCTPLLSESVNFVRNILRPALVEDFIKDCAELEDLRGWIWEQHRNWSRTMKEASNDEREWGTYIREKIDSFCDKYGLYLNID